jgi:hypothetical protein
VIRFDEHAPVIVCGGRDGQPYGEVAHGMDCLRGIVDFNAVVVGSNKGTDRQAFDWAVTHELIATVVMAQWLTGTPKGRAAGPTRNSRMPRLFPSVRAVAAFPGGDGTEDMVAKAVSGQLPTWRWLGRRDRWRRIT